MQTPTTALQQQSTGGAMQQSELAMPVPAAAIRARHEALGQIMASVMQKGTDYDNIPGTNKPTLLKPGAETLMSCFALHPEVAIIEHFDPTLEQHVEIWETEWSGPKENRKKTRTQRTVHKRGFYEVVARCTLKAPSGVALGTLSGSCNNFEAKYITQSLHDVKNTILKMAEKRAIVAAVLAVTGASRVFTQDMEDFREQAAQDAASASVPAAGAAPAPAKSPRREPTADEWLAWNKEQLAAQTTAEAARAYRCTWGRAMTQEERERCRVAFAQFRADRMAELNAAEQAKQAGQASEGSQLPAEQPAPKPAAPAEPKARAHSDEALYQKASALYQRLASTDKGEAQRIWSEVQDNQLRIDELHTVLLRVDSVYQSRHAPTMAEAKVHSHHPDWDPSEQ